MSTSDVHKSHGLALRRGVTEFLANAPDQSDLEIRFPLTQWAAIVTGGTTLKKAVSDSKAQVTGDAKALTPVVASFDPITTPKDNQNIDACH